MASWTHCSWAFKKATASFIYRMRASNHRVVPKEEKPLRTRPKFKNTGKSILQAEVTVRAATWPLTVGQAPARLHLYPHRHVRKPQQTWGHASHFPTEAQQSQ